MAQAAARLPLLDACEIALFLGGRTPGLYFLLPGRIEALLVPATRAEARPASRLFILLTPLR